MEFPAASIVCNKAAAIVIREINAKDAAVVRPDGPLCSNRRDQFTVKVSVVQLDHDAREVSHFHAP